MKNLRELLFTPTSPLPMALFRIGVGFLLQLKLILLWPQWRLWFTDAGPLSLDASVKMTGLHRIAIWNELSLAGFGNWVQPTYLGVLYLLGVCLMLGLFTRLSAFLSFVLLVSLHHRNVLILHSGDTLMRMQLFALIFSPAGMALSLDTKVWSRARRLNSIFGSSFGRRVLTLLASPDPEIRAWAPWTQRFMQMQLMVAYTCTAFWKLGGSMWRDGTALYVTSQLSEFVRIPMPWIFEKLWLVKLMTWSTLILEFTLGLFLWLRPIRPFLLIAGLGLHLGIELTMNIPLFQIGMLVTYAVFLDPEWIESRLDGYRIARGADQYDVAVSENAT